MMFRVVLFVLFTINSLFSNDLKKVQDESFYGLSLSLEEIKYIKENPLIKVHNESNWPPFNYNEKGKSKGFSIDYMKLLASKAGMEVEFISGYTWSQYMDMVHTDDLDIICNIVKNEERSKSMIFSDVFFKTQNVIYVNKNNQNFETLKDLEYQKIAIPKGFFTQSYLKNNYSKIKQVLVKDQLEALKLLSLGKVDAAIGKKTVMDHLIEKNSIPLIVATKYIDDKGLVAPLRLASSKNNPILISILKKAQKQVSHKEFRELITKWFGVVNKTKSSYTKEQKEYLRSKKNIKVCIREDMAPLEFFTDGMALGISVDILKLIERKLNTKFEFIPVSSLEEANGYLKERRCDILSSAFKTEEGLKYANFTKVYQEYDLAIITRDDKPLVAGLGSIAHKTISINTADPLISKLQKEYPELKILKKINCKESLSSVYDGKSYFTLSCLPVYSYNKNLYGFDDLHIAGYSDIKYSLRVALRNDEPRLLPIFNIALGQITDDTMNVIYEKWLNQKKLKEIDYDLIWKLLVVFLIILMIILFFMLRQNRLKQTIEKQKETFENLYLKSSDGILLVENGHIIDCNESVITLLGYERKDQLLDLHPNELYPKYQPDGSVSLIKAKTLLNRALFQGTNSFEWVYKKADGKEIWTDVVLTKINLEKKDIIHAVLRDIETRKKAQEELSELNRTLKEMIKVEVNKNREKDKQMLAQSRLAQMGELLSMIAHQWRQPLSSINNTAINLKFKLELETFDLDNKDERGEFERVFKKELEDIEKYVSNLTSTIDDFRNFYKPNRSKSIDTVSFPIKNALNIIKQSLEVNGVEVSLDYRSFSKFEMYDTELMQVFLNILQNSLDSFKEIEKGNKYINITTKDTPDGIKISLCDNAGGIPEKVLPNIFDPYFSTKSKKNGTGLGLYMSKIIIEEHHNGKIIGYNKDNGTCFDIIINVEK